MGRLTRAMPAAASEAHYGEDLTGLRCSARRTCNDITTSMLENGT